MSALIRCHYLELCSRLQRVPSIKTKDYASETLCGQQEQNNKKLLKPTLVSRNWRVPEWLPSILHAILKQPNSKDSKPGLVRTFNLVIQECNSIWSLIPPTTSQCSQALSVQMMMPCRDGPFSSCGLYCRTETQNLHFLLCIERMISMSLVLGVVEPVVHLDSRLLQSTVFGAYLLMASMVVAICRLMKVIWGHGGLSDFG